MISEDIRQLVEDEQARKSGRFIDNMPLDDYLAKLGKHAEFLIHYSEGQIAGLVAFYCTDKASKTAFITLVLTSPSARGKKVASGLIDGVLANTRERGFRQCGLEVRKDNSAAIALYQKKGFRISSETDSSYLMSAMIEPARQGQKIVA